MVTTVPEAVLAARRAEHEADLANALSFLRRRRLMQGIEAMAIEEREHKAKILAKLEELVAALKDPDAAEWALQIEADSHAGSGLIGYEEALRWLFFHKGPRGWWVTLSNDGLAIARTAARGLTEQTGKPWTLSGVAQLVANAAAAHVSADPDAVAKRIVERIHELKSLKKWPRKRHASEYDAFIESRLGSELEMAVSGRGGGEHLCASDIVNLFLYDRAFMTELMATVRVQLAIH